MKTHTAASLFFSLMILLALSACKDSKKVEVTLSAEDFSRQTYMIELPAGEILEKLGSPAYYIVDEKGTEIPYQLTYDSLIIFRTPLADEKTLNFTILPSDSLHTYKPITGGDFYPKRRDDLAYENDLGGYRIYGPGTRDAGEKSFGYDLFFKYPDEELILPSLYEAQTSSELWSRVDSLRRIDPKLAKEFEDSFSYHIDHGKGMDSYAVGSTLGAGVPALLGEEIIYPWVYESAEILDNGPLRFTYTLNFPEIELEDGRKVREHRLTSLDASSFLNKSKVWYEGLESKNEVVTGFPLRDETEPVYQTDKGILIYSAPAQDPKYGRALLGLVIENPVDSFIINDNHALLAVGLEPGDTLSYSWGFSWDKEEISNVDEWLQYLSRSSQKPLIHLR